MNATHTVRSNEGTLECLGTCRELFRPVISGSQDRLHSELPTKSEPFLE